jgi:preprotein translocase subunit SecE
VVATVIFTILWRQGAFLRLSTYVSETMEELRKCSWPTWDELTGSTLVVIIAVGILGLFTYVVDLVVGSLLQHII